MHYARYFFFLEATVETLLVLHFFLVIFQVAIDVPEDARVCLIHQRFENSLVFDCFRWQNDLKDTYKRSILLYYFISLKL